MKKLLLVALFGAAASGAFAQGRVAFANVGLDSNNAFYQNPFTLQATGQPLDGSGYTVELLGGVDAGSLAALTPTVSTFNSGLFSGGDVVVPGATSTGSFQVRAWDNAGGTVTSYSAAVTAGLATAISGVWSQSVVNTASAPAAAMPLLPGLALVAVPEPSVIGLALVGAGLMFARRKKLV